MSEYMHEPLPGTITDEKWHEKPNQKAPATPLSEADQRMMDALQRGVDAHKSGMMVTVASKIDPNETFRL